MILSYYLVLISLLADVTLYPTIIFCDYILSQLFKWEKNSFNSSDYEL